MGSSILTSRFIVTSIFLFVSFQLAAQESLEEQYQQFYEKANSWEEYKMIKKPGLSDFWNVVSDTLDAQQQKINDAIAKVKSLENNIEELNSKLNDTESSLATSNQLNDSISFMGVEMSKAVYNIFVWAIIAAFALLAVSTFLMFKRSNSVTQDTRAAFAKLETQFDDHRESSREMQVKLKRELQTALNALHDQKVR